MQSKPGLALERLQGTLRYVRRHPGTHLGAEALLLGRELQIERHGREPSVLRALLVLDEGIARFLRVLVQVHLEREALLEAIVAINVARFDTVQGFLGQYQRAAALRGNDGGKGARFLQQILRRHHLLDSSQAVGLGRRDARRR